MICNLFEIGRFMVSGSGHSSFSQLLKPTKKNVEINLKKMIRVKILVMSIIMERGISMQFTINLKITTIRISLGNQELLYV